MRSPEAKQLPSKGLSSMKIMSTSKGSIKNEGLLSPSAKSDGNLNSCCINVRCMPEGVIIKGWGRHSDGESEGGRERGEAREEQKASLEEESRR